MGFSIFEKPQTLLTATGFGVWGSGFKEEPQPLLTVTVKGLGFWGLGFQEETLKPYRTAVHARRSRVDSIELTPPADTTPWTHWVSCEGSVERFL